MTEDAPAGTVVVIGAGTMGVGIAHVFLHAGAPVVLIDQEQRLADALRAVTHSLESADRRAGATGIARAPECLGRIRLQADLPDDPTTELVIEAVPEDAGLKGQVLANAARLCPDATLATNTSSLGIGALARSVPRPGRFLGMHFFNPVPRSALVELVCHPLTSDDTVQRARGWVERLGLEHITTSDTPGFATSRLGVLVGLEAARMLEEGVATAEDIDTAMRLGYRWPVGPLRLSDMVGLDVRLAIASHLARELGSRFEPPQILLDKVRAGELGRKTGQGFFSW